MIQNASTYNVWIGGSCDYGHKERAGSAAVVIEQIEQRKQSEPCHSSAESRQKKAFCKLDVKVISKDVIADFNTTEFRMMLTLMVKVMNELPEGSNIIFHTNAAYIQNFDKTPTQKSANPDLIARCIESKQRHNNVSVKIVPYHKSPLLIETHATSTEAMKKLRLELMKQRKQGNTQLLSALGTLAKSKNPAE